MHAHSHRQAERQYKKTLDDAKASITVYFTTPPPASCTLQNTTPIKAHYSFNMALYPNHPFNLAVCIFLPLEGALFGVCCKAIPCQVNY